MFVFSLLMFLTSFLLIVRQIEVWRFKHEEKIKIMDVFGAPIWLRSAWLYKMAVIDSVVSTGLVSLCLHYLAKSRFLNTYLQKIDLHYLRFDGLADTLVLFALALIISIASVAFVVLKSEEG